MSSLSSGSGLQTTERYTLEALGVSKKLLVGIFTVIFVGLLCYWIYEVYYIHSTELNISSTPDVLVAVGHEVAAYQAAVLSFLILALLVYIL